MIGPIYKYVKYKKIVSPTQVIYYYMYKSSFIDIKYYVFTTKFNILGHGHFNITF